ALAGLAGQHSGVVDIDALEAGAITGRAEILRDVVSDLVDAVGRYLVAREWGARSAQGIVLDDQVTFCIQALRKIPGPLEPRGNRGLDRVAMCVAIAFDCEPEKCPVRCLV